MHPCYTKGNTMYLSYTKSNLRLMVKDVEICVHIFWGVVVWDGTEGPGLL